MGKVCIIVRTNVGQFHTSIHISPAIHMKSKSEPDSFAHFLHIIYTFRRTVQINHVYNIYHVRLKFLTPPGLDIITWFKNQGCEKPNGLKPKQAVIDHENNKIAWLVIHVVSNHSNKSQKDDTPCRLFSRQGKYAKFTPRRPSKVSDNIEM